METKICTKCNTEKPITEFRWKYKERGVRDTHCKTCTRTAGKDHYARNTEDVKSKSLKRSKAYGKQNRMWKQQLRCVVCEEDDDWCLEFHHLDPTVKEKSITTMMGSYTLSCILREALKCLVVCANCHRKVHHGTLQLTQEHTQKSKEMINNAHVHPLASNQKKG